MKAIDFCLPDKDEKEICLSSFKGKWIILYFYPKDNTPGCTKEAVSFSENISKFKKLNAVVIGVSKDPPTSHSKFYFKYNLKIILLSDNNKEVLKKYGVWKLKKLYGKEHYGVERSTFLISPEFEIVKEWRKIKVNGHVEEVLNTLKSFVKSG